MSNRERRFLSVDAIATPTGGAFAAYELRPGAGVREVEIHRIEADAAVAIASHTLGTLLSNAVTASSQRFGADDSAGPVSAIEHGDYASNTNDALALVYEFGAAPLVVASGRTLAIVATVADSPRTISLLFDELF